MNHEYEGPFIHFKWIEFRKLKKDPKRKTDIYHCCGDGGASFLGTIAWYGPWRKFTFQPLSNCIFETECLSDIISFLNNIMDERKQANTGR